MADEPSAVAAAPAAGSAPQAGAPAGQPAAASDTATLLDQAVSPAAPAGAPAAADPAAAAAVAAAAVPAVPEWFDSKKYKTVEDQAKAYPEARKELDAMREKLKGFAGAPDKYELSVPEELKEELEWLPDNPLLNQFQSIAKEEGMSQKTFDRLLHTFAQYEHSNSTVDFKAEMATLGERANERLQGFWQWAESTFDEETAGTVKKALGVWPSPAVVFQALEAVRSGTRQPAIQVANDADGGGTSVESINAKYRSVDPATKKALIDTPEGQRAYRAELAKIVGTGDHKVIVGQRKAG